MDIPSNKIYTGAVERNGRTIVLETEDPEELRLFHETQALIEESLRENALTLVERLCDMGCTPETDKELVEYVYVRFNPEERECISMSDELIAQLPPLLHAKAAQLKTRFEDRVAKRREKNPARIVLAEIVAGNREVTSADIPLLDGLVSDMARELRF